MTIHQGNLLDLIEDTPEPAQPQPIWRAPPMDMRRLTALEVEGRPPFGSDGYDPVGAQGIADETMRELVNALATLALMNRLVGLGRIGFSTAKAWQNFIKAEPGRRQALVGAYEDTLAAIEDVWGAPGRDAFDQEARRRAGLLEKR